MIVLKIIFEDDTKNKNICNAWINKITITLFALGTEI